MFDLSKILSKKFALPDTFKSKNYSKRQMNALLSILNVANTYKKIIGFEKTISVIFN